MTDKEKETPAKEAKEEVKETKATTESTTDTPATDAGTETSEKKDAGAGDGKTVAPQAKEVAAEEEPEEEIDPSSLLPFLEGCHALGTAKIITQGTYASLSAKVARLIIGYQKDGEPWHAASNDSGRTWCEPAAFSAVVDEPVKDCRFGDAVAVHIMEDLTAVAVCSQGVFYSRAAGALWRHVPSAGAGDTIEGPVLVPGSTMFEHPNFGLVLTGHVVDGEPGKLLIRTTENKGESWFDFHQDLPKGMELVHPAILSLRGAFFMLAPNLGGKRKGGKWHYAELHANHGRLPFAAAESTLCAVEPKRSKLGALSMDVPALAWNEERQRIEAVISYRGGNAEHDPEGTGMSMHLWSTSPHDWLAGTPNWQHDCCLVAVPPEVSGPDKGFAPSVAVAGGARHLVFQVEAEEGPTLCYMALPSIAL